LDLVAVVMPSRKRLYQLIGRQIVKSETASGEGKDSQQVIA
jgi:hypothetical protein